MTHQIKISGRGGEGVVLAGEILACAAVLEGKFASSIPSYGSQVKGGEVSSVVIISEKEIICPFLTRLDYLLCFSQFSYDANRELIQKETVVVLDSRCENLKFSKNHFPIPAKEIGEELGSEQVANMVLLGGFANRTKIVSLESLVLVLSERMKGRSLEINLLGLRRGYKSGGKI